MSCTPWDSTSPRRSAWPTANKKKKTRNSPTSTMLSRWSTLPWLPQKTMATTMTTLNCANCTTKMRMEPWCWLSSKTFCPTWLMRSPRKILLPSSPNWLTQKMKMVSSHTLHSSTDCAARLNLVANQKTIKIIKSAKCHSARLDKIFFSIWQTFQRTKFFEAERIEDHFKNMSNKIIFNMDIYDTTKGLDLDLG